MLTFFGEGGINGFKMIHFELLHGFFICYWTKQNNEVDEMSHFVGL